MIEGYHYHPNPHGVVVGATGVQAHYPYPFTIPDTDFEDQGDREQDMANIYNNGNVGPYQDQGGGGGNWEVDDSSCTRRRQRDEK